MEEKECYNIGRKKRKINRNNEKEKLGNDYKWNIEWEMYWKGKQKNVSVITMEMSKTYINWWITLKYM